MSIFQQAAELNSEGVKALLSGQKRSALVSFASSIRLLKRALLQQQSQRKGEPSHHVAPNTVGIRCLEATTILIPTLREQIDSTLFNRVFHIPVSIDDESLNDEEMAICVSEVIFNTALVYHHLQKPLKAASLYTLAMAGLEDIISFETSFARLSLVVRLACINNLTLLLYSMGDQAWCPAHQHRVFLSQVSLFLLCRHQQESSPHQRGEELSQIESLLINILFQKPSPAASAA